MFDGFKRLWKGIRRMFGYTTLKQIVGKDIAFSDITEEFGHSFKLFLKKELGYASGHVNHCLCWLNRLIYIAVDDICN